MTITCGSKTTINRVDDGVGKIKQYKSLQCCDYPNEITKKYYQHFQTPCEIFLKKIENVQKHYEGMGSRLNMWFREGSYFL